MKVIHTSSSQKTAFIDVNLNTPPSGWLAAVEKQSLFDRYFMTAISIALLGITGGIVTGYCIRWDLWQIAAVVSIALLPLMSMLFFAVIKYMLSSPEK